MIAGTRLALRRRCDARGERERERERVERWLNAARYSETVERLMQPPIGALLARLPWRFRFCAITFGHVILGVDPPALAAAPLPGAAPLTGVIGPEGYPSLLVAQPAHGEELESPTRFASSWFEIRASD